MMGLHRQAPPLLAVKGTLARTLGSAETLFGMANTPCLPTTEQEQEHKKLSCSANALQHPDLPSVNHSLDITLWVLSKTADI